jgi:hypothetical protein
MPKRPCSSVAHHARTQPIVPEVVTFAFQRVLRLLSFPVPTFAMPWPLAVARNNISLVIRPFILTGRIVQLPSHHFFRSTAPLSGCQPQPPIGTGYAAPERSSSFLIVGSLKLCDLLRVGYGELMPIHGVIARSGYTRSDFQVKSRGMSEFLAMMVEICNNSCVGASPNGGAIFWFGFHLLHWHD